MSVGLNVSRWRRKFWMFEPSLRPRLFGVPPGVDFPRALIGGLRRRLRGQPSEALARVEIFVNSRAMQWRLKSLFMQGPATLVPRIQVVTDLSRDVRFLDIPLPASPLRRRLELTQLVGKLLELQPDLAPRSALFALADSLAGLLDEMQSEGVTPECIRDLDVVDVSGHWQRGLQFVSLVERYFASEFQQGLDALSRQRLVAERLAEEWSEEPPAHPIIVAGSTGSRGATALFMRAVAQLPQGAVVLPCMDFDLPPSVWERLGDALTTQDHPQYRFARLCGDLGSLPAEIRPWEPSLQPPSPERNRLVSLALRPAPVTDQWLAEGAGLAGIRQATEAITLIEAPSPRAEASAVALMLRHAVEKDRTAALLTADRTLTREVIAALDRWAIRPDDSAGTPLPLTAAGRFLRQVADLFGQALSGTSLLALLKHPLSNASAADRTAHLRNTRALELKLRRSGPSFPGASDLRRWAANSDSQRLEWAEWLACLLDGLSEVGERSLTEHVDHHIRLAESLAAGPAAEDSSRLWEGQANARVWEVVDELSREARYGGMLTPTDYASLFDSVLWRAPAVPTVTTVHHHIMIWGPQQSRVQGADLVILAGMNEGHWPVASPPDPWLNRQLRAQAGLLLPERAIGLAAHDLQQAIAAPETVLSRAIRDSESPTVQSRWLNRLTNLLEGLSDDGAEALVDMRMRGNHWLELAQRLDMPEERTPSAPRPAPRPPVTYRPTRISVTEVERLIRDPYAIYARRILDLRSLDPLRHLPDAPMRGTVIHQIVERFIGEELVGDHATDCARLLQVADDVMETEVEWPATRRLWRARLAGIADWFVAGEAIRQAGARPVALERSGSFLLPQTKVTLHGKIDRIDRREDGSLLVYDYKTGTPPTRSQQEHFDKQLLLSAILIEHGAVESLEAGTVAGAAYLGLGTNPKIESTDLDECTTQDTLEELECLLAKYRSPERGYMSRRAVRSVSYGGDFDHLARFGEWSDSDDPTPQDVG